MADGYAKIAIRTMFLLNGGALIAFPAIAQLVGTSFHENVSWVLYSLGSFVIGLVFISVTTVLAYLSMNSDKDAVQHIEAFVKYGLNASQESDPQKRAAAKVLQKRTEDDRKRDYGRARCFAIAGLLLAASSLAAFVIGALFTAKVLLGATDTFEFAGIILMRR